jgi:hypothetical protein
VNADDRAELETLAMTWRQTAAHLESGGTDAPHLEKVAAALAGVYYVAAADLIQTLRGMA